MYRSLAAKAAVCLAVGYASLTLLTGCEDSQQQADRSAQAQVEIADQASTKATTLEELDNVQHQFDSIANQTGMSTETQIIVRGRQAQLRYQRILMMISDLNSQQQLAGRDIDDINQLAAQVASCEASLDSINH